MRGLSKNTILTLASFVIILDMSSAFKSRALFLIFIDKTKSLIIC